MTELFTAAFLILIGSQEPCREPGSFAPYMPGTFGPDSWLHMSVGVPVSVVPVKDRAALNEAFSRAWLGDRCSTENEVTIRVLDVKAGRWLEFKQIKVTRKREIAEPTGDYRMEPPK